MKSDAFQSIKKVALTDSLTFEDKFILLRIKLESLFKHLFNSKSKRANLIIALFLLLWFLMFNATEAYVALLFALRSFLKSGNLLENLKDMELEKSQFYDEKLFDDALVKFEDKIPLEIFKNVDEKVLVEVLEYSKDELEKILLK